MTERVFEGKKKLKPCLFEVFLGPVRPETAKNLFFWGQKSSLLERFTNTKIRSFRVTRGGLRATNELKSCLFFEVFLGAVRPLPLSSRCVSKAGNS